MTLPQNGTFVRRADYIVNDEDEADLDVRWETYIPFKNQVTTYTGSRSPFVMPLPIIGAFSNVRRFALDTGIISETITVQGFIKEDSITNSRMLAAHMLKAHRYWFRKGLTQFDWLYNSDSGMKSWDTELFGITGAGPVFSYTHLVLWSSLTFPMPSKQDIMIPYTAVFTLAEFLKREGV